MNLLIVLPCCGHCSKLNFKLLHKYKLLYQATKLDDSPLVINVVLKTNSSSQRENVFTQADIILKIKQVLDDKLVFESLGKHTFTLTHTRDLWVLMPSINIRQATFTLFKILHQLDRNEFGPSRPCGRKLPPLPSPTSC